MQIPRLATLVVVAAASFVGAISARADIPGASDAKAYTQRDYAKAKLDFCKRTLSGYYESSGLKGREWDAQAVKFLDAVAARMTYGALSAEYRDAADAPTLDECIALGQAATDAGCEDPLVAYCYGRTLADAGRYAEAKPLLADGATRMLKRGYPPYHTATAANMAIWLLSAPEDRADAMEMFGVRLRAMSSAASLKMADKYVRFVAEIINPIFVGTDDRERLTICRAAEASKDANPWIVQYLYGQYETKAAWTARGGGWAKNVTPEGWKGFYEHLGNARDRLAKAHALHPEFPEAATEMIAVAMGAGSRLNEKTRDWFDKAVKGQLDYAPAYSAYIYSIYPRWGGSREEMLHFGAECMATNRYDTIVPWRMMHILDAINADQGGDYAVFAEPGVKASLTQLFAKQVAAAKSPDQKSWYGSYEVALAWRSGQYADAAALMDKMGAGLNPAPFKSLQAWPTGAISQIRAMNTPHAKRIAQAEKEVEDGEYEAAVVTLRGVASKLDKDHPGQLYLRYRAKALEFQLDFAGGDWVSLEQGEQLAPWTVVSGDWKVDDDGALVATADKHGQAILLCRTEFGPHYEFRAKIDSPDPAKPAVAGLIPQYVEGRPVSIGGVDPAAKAVFASGKEPGGRRDATLKGGERITLKVEGDQFALSLDDKPMIARRGLTPGTQSREAFVAIGIVGQDAGRQARFSDIQIRMVKPKD